MHMHAHTYTHTHTQYKIKRKKEKKRKNEEQNNAALYAAFSFSAFSTFSTFAQLSVYFTLIRTIKNPQDSEVCKCKAVNITKMKAEKWCCCLWVTIDVLLVAIEN